MKLSRHYIEDVQSKRPYLTLDILEDIIKNPVKTELQADKRMKIWGCSNLYDKFIRIVIDSDKETIITAFFDRNFKQEGM
jgi:hypothetical protein